MDLRNGGILRIQSDVVLGDISRRFTEYNPDLRVSIRMFFDHIKSVKLTEK